MILISQAAGARDREREQDIFGNFSWIHTFSPSVLFTLAPSYHFNRAAFEGLGDEADRVVTTDNRLSSYIGGTATVSVVKGRHNAKFGMYGFAQHDNTLIALTGNDPDTGLVDFPATRQKANGDLEAFWVEDQYKATSWLSLNAGRAFNALFRTGERK